MFLISDDEIVCFALQREISLHVTKYQLLFHVIYGTSLFIPSLQKFGPTCHCWTSFVGLLPE